MRLHFYSDCPVKVEGDEILDIDSLELEEWIYDCEVCSYIESARSDSWSGGFVNGIIRVLCSLGEVATAINVGKSKLFVLRQLLQREGDNYVPQPGYLPLLIMTPEELEPYTCPNCNAGTYYVFSETGEDVWQCGLCNYERRFPIADRIG